MQESLVGKEGGVPPQTVGNPVVVVQAQAAMPMQPMGQPITQQPGMVQQPGIVPVQVVAQPGQAVDW